MVFFGGRARGAALAGALFCLARAVFALDLSLHVGDLRVTQGADGGYHLYIRKKGDIQSVMLCETTRDPNMAADTYAYRAREDNAVNGGEKRVLDGRFIAPERRNTYLMSSTAVYNEDAHAEMFHIYIPYIIMYGYPEGRHGEVYVGSGTFLNIRAFALPYGDYAGAFADNPFELQVAQKPLGGPPEANYMKDALEAAERVTAAGGGELVRSKGPADVVPALLALLSKEEGDSVDAAIVLDTTASMRDDIEKIKKELVKALEPLLGEKKYMRIGFMLFKDYSRGRDRELYLTRMIGFSSDPGRLRTTLNAVRVSGGGDIPEAVHEALYEAAVKMDWKARARLMVLVTDAPPHPRALGGVGESDVIREARARGIRVSAVILPQ